MLYVENTIRDLLHQGHDLKKENPHLPEPAVVLIITPIYYKDELIPRLVRYDIANLKQNGAGVTEYQQYYILNVAPDYKINYYTGEFKKVK